jgi:hypothetical protein
MNERAPAAGIIRSTEIRTRGERRLGEMVAAQREGVGLNRGSHLVSASRTRQDDRPTLGEAGIDKSLSARSAASAHQFI